MPALLAPVADSLWELSHPLSLGPFTMTHRMSVARLSSGGLWVHSPVVFSEALGAELEALGPVQYLVAPSLFHDLYWREWLEAYPEARALCAPGFRQRHPDLAFTDELGAESPNLWGDEIDSVFIEGMPGVNELVFLHTPSRTLVVADLVFNMGRDVDFPTSLLLRATGAHNRLAVSRLFRMYIKDRAALLRSVDRVLERDFDRLLVGHGHRVESEGRQHLMEACAVLRG